MNWTPLLEEEIDSLHLREFFPIWKKLNKPGLIDAKDTEELILFISEILLQQTDPFFLKLCSRFLTPIEYDLIMNERNIIHLCGYPLCNVTADTIKCRDPSKMQLPYAYWHQFCSKAHQKASNLYKAQLNSDPLWLRPNILYSPYGSSVYETRIILLEEILEGSKSVEDITLQMSHMHIDQSQRPKVDINDILER
ncbi:hypothetical protein CANCADRAFT_2756 [Tortispora caseinolytica NRRL Y-17796]|uniref:RNA polymerase II subunit B1 CTD phosphatase RPAP2 homolog n=1 Tax=Tortispora caseinolytica NRRL Y-17796 TaxID=767744 RepID=A0A1E4TH51_9ASCO|nr:hypothetical protein CANCADRAFT_2756 [Tortispora caseinolytica NRRL Y-17796]